MSTFLTAQSVTLSYHSTPIFESLDCHINRGDKIGLIGHNGCGKSSLLKLLTGQLSPTDGHVARANHCSVRHVEQYLPENLTSVSLIEALADQLAEDEIWRAECLLAELGFEESVWRLPVAVCSGGQQMRLLLARAIINEPDLLLLDEPSNHLDLPSLLWLEAFLTTWKGAFVLVSHDQQMLDAVTTTTWILRDRTLYHYDLPCTLARAALAHKDEQDAHRHAHEQKEIDRIEKSAKRLATWGKVYDNEDLARKAKSMLSRKARLEASQTVLSEGAPWQLMLQGESLPANRLVEILPLNLCPPGSSIALFSMPEMRLKSGDRVAVLGSNGSGKSTLLHQLYQAYLGHRDRQVPDTKQVDRDKEDRASSHRYGDQVIFHDRCRVGYYDQSQRQIASDQTLIEALANFASVSFEQSKRALISAGFAYVRHGQSVDSLSGGERARLLFVGLTLAAYHLLFLDEPTNHLDMDGQMALIETLQTFEGAALVVSHDRQLIEQACNRFWLIQGGQLRECQSAEEIYVQLACHQPERLIRSAEGDGGDIATAESAEDQLLERLLELERLLANHLRQKPKRQNRQRLQRWREEIAAIEARLS